MLDEVLDLLLVEVEDQHVLGLVLLLRLELPAVLAHEVRLDLLKLLVQHDVLQRADYLVEEGVLGRAAVVCIVADLLSAKISSWSRSYSWLG